MTHQAPHKPLIAALSVEVHLIPGVEHQSIKLLPAGEFRGVDGRPFECPAWVLDGNSAAVLVAAAASRQTRYVIDYEHQTLRAAENGKEAIAAGWFKTLEWREGDGLYATDVKWTAKASTHINAEEYLYLSPVFIYAPDGRVQQLLHVALTNTPCLDELPPLSLAALSRLAALSTNQPETENMDELLEQLRWLLNLPVGSTADDVKAQLQKLTAQLNGEQTTAAAGVDLLALLADQKAQIAALSATQADPAKFVPIAVVQQLQGQVAALTAQVQIKETDDLVTAALNDGRLVPAMEGWARDLAKTNVAALKGYLDSAPKVAALSGTQTNGKQPPADQTGQLDEATLAVCKAFGNNPDDVKKNLEG